MEEDKLRKLSSELQKARQENSVLTDELKELQHNYKILQQSVSQGSKRSTMLENEDKNSSLLNNRKNEVVMNHRSPERKNQGRE